MKSKQIRQYLEHSKILCDGAFGTYYALLFDNYELPELANLDYPERVRQIHIEYLEAGARLIRTNTFACNQFTLYEEQDKVDASIEAAYNIALQAASEYNDRFVAADIGPITYENLYQQNNVQEEYVRIVSKFLSLGAEIFLFETFTAIDDILPALNEIGNKAFVIVQFAVNQFGYSSAGLSVRKLFEEAHKCSEVDAIGLNCGIGPGHMESLISTALSYSDKYITALPNAGYPEIISNRMIFSNKNMDYFVNKVIDIAKDGVNIIGGCCGTTPEYIRKISTLLQSVKSVENKKSIKIETEKPLKQDKAFFKEKDKKKLIAVELAPPLGSNASALMDAANMLKLCNVDVVTFPDSPSGRTRADSILMAEKVAGETGLCVMPHICCRDKNAIAMRSQLLGAYINGIDNFLVITGDPIPSIMRNSVESVFNFDSIGLMNIINDMNEDTFDLSNITFGGAINQGRRNLSVEIGRVKKKMQAGAAFFMTQPVFSDEDIKCLRQIKEETGARILYGIMPFVSLKNAMFMKNEMTGINVTDEVIARYRADMTKEEGEAAGIKLAKEIIDRTYNDADGYYFSFPFNRVHMLKSII